MQSVVNISFGRRDCAGRTYSHHYTVRVLRHRACGAAPAGVAQEGVGHAGGAAAAADDDESDVSAEAAQVDSDEDAAAAASSLAGRGRASDTWRKRESSRLRELAASAASTSQSLLLNDINHPNHAPDHSSNAKARAPAPCANSAEKEEAEGGAHDSRRRNSQGMSAHERVSPSLTALRELEQSRQQLRRAEAADTRRRMLKEGDTEGESGERIPTRVSSGGFHTRQDTPSYALLDRSAGAGTQTAGPESAHARREGAEDGAGLRSADDDPAVPHLRNRFLLPRFFLLTFHPFPPVYPLLRAPRLPLRANNTLHCVCRGRTHALAHLRTHAPTHSRTHASTAYLFCAASSRGCGV